MYINPYENLTGGRWLKTNFHTHAGTGEGTCGRYPIDFVLGQYRELGYGAVCISNHDLYTDTSALSDENFCLLQGVEYSHDGHMLTIGVNRSMHDLPHQAAIDETNGQGGFVILCHPNWIRKEYWLREKLDAISGYAGIEVINTLIYRLSGSGRATDAWDYLLRQGRLIYGFGDDDFHMPYDAGRGYTDIYARECSPAGIDGAVRAGAFTASTGLSLVYLTLDGGKTIRVKVKFPTETYVNEFYYRFINENGAASEFYGESAEYALNGDRYVRVEAVAENGAMLFTQPVYDSAYFK